MSPPPAWLALEADCIANFCRRRRALGIRTGEHASGRPQRHTLPYARFAAFHFRRSGIPAGSGSTERTTDRRIHHRRVHALERRADNCDVRADGLSPHESQIHTVAHVHALSGRSRSRGRSDASARLPNASGHRALPAQAANRTHAPLEKFSAFAADAVAETIPGTTEGDPNATQGVWTARSWDDPDRLRSEASEQHFACWADRRSIAVLRIEAYLSEIVASASMRLIRAISSCWRANFSAPAAPAIATAYRAWSGRRYAARSPRSARMAGRHRRLESSTRADHSSLRRQCTDEIDRIRTRTARRGSFSSLTSICAFPSSNSWHALNCPWAAMGRPRKTSRESGPP